MKSAMEERKEVWKRAQNARKRLCLVSEAKTVAEMQAAVTRAKEAFKIRFKLNEGHEVTILAMDCAWGTQKKPWQEAAQTGSLSKRQVEAAFDYMNSSCQKSFELGFAFDGRSKARRSMLAELTGFESMSEGMLMYQEPEPKKNPEGQVRTRRLPFSALQHEMYYCKLGCGNKSKLAARRRWVKCLQGQLDASSACLQPYNVTAGKEDHGRIGGHYRVNRHCAGWIQRRPVCALHVVRVKGSGLLD